MKQPSYKPASYPSVSPYLVVADAEGMIRFLIRVFDGTEIRRATDSASGRIMHAEVRVDDSVIMVGQSMDEWPPVPMVIHVYVPNVDETYERALNEGATAIQKPVQKGDEDKRGGFSDAWGNSWWIGTRVGLPD